MREVSAQDGRTYNKIIYLDDYIEIARGVIIRSEFGAPPVIGTAIRPVIPFKRNRLLFYTAASSFISANLASKLTTFSSLVSSDGIMSFLTTKSLKPCSAKLGKFLREIIEHRFSNLKNFLTVLL